MPVNKKPLITDERMKKIVNDMTSQSQNELNLEYYKQADKVYKEIADVFIRHNIPMDQSYVILQSLADAVYVFMYGNPNPIGFGFQPPE